MAHTSLSRRPENVLVLGDGVSAFLAVVRSLGRQGIEVHAAWCQPDSPTLSSRYVKRFHRLPFYDAQSDWADRFSALLDREQFDLVLPTNEQSMRALHSRRRDLETKARLYLVDDRTFDIVFDKVKCGQLAEDLGLQIPRARVVATDNELKEAAEQLGYPLVLKPISSYDPNLPLQRRDVVKAYSPEELELRGTRLLAAGPIQIQENFIGRGVGVELLVDRGDVLFAFQHERVHQPPRGGASSYRKSVPLNQNLLEASKKFVGALKYSGVIMIEFLVNATEDWRFVEANARFWGSLPLAVAAGADFPYALYRYWVHGDREFPQSYREGLYCRNALSDGLWLVHNLRADRSDPTLATVSPLSLLGEASHLLTGRERFDTLTLDDPRPAAAEVFKYARRLFRRSGNRLRQACVSLPGVRRWQSAHTRDALSRANRVIFLCWGNICRSPFAASYARKVWPARIDVLSRGLHHQQSRISPAEAIEAARSFEVALDDHRSSLISDQDVAAAEMIICFDEIIRRELLARHPEARRKTFRFGMLSSQGSVNVADPFGGGPEMFQDAYAQIRAALDESGQVFERTVPRAVPPRKVVVKDTAP
jgi:protein-tyrosine-phosphatase/predicted ATP-grasp superfamily ATP-dependent carboligase